MNPDKRQRPTLKTAPWPLLALGLALVLWSSWAAALSSDRQQPIDIAADSVDINEAKGQSTYSGHVEINQGSIRLLADQVVVEHRPGQPRRIKASGNPAKFRQLPDDSKAYITGSARRIEYGLDSEELLLMGNASLKQGKDSFSSDRIVYDRERAVVKAGAAAQGKERVKVTIQPGK
jgi:lipopolysaccharide export system protein LptA